MLLSKVLSFKPQLIITILIFLSFWRWMYLLCYRRKKENENRKERLLSYFPIKIVPELLKILEAEGREPKEYYFETYYITAELHFDNICLIQEKIVG